MLYVVCLLKIDVSVAWKKKKLFALVSFFFQKCSFDYCVDQNRHSSTHIKNWRVEFQLNIPELISTPKVID